MEAVILFSHGSLLCGAGEALDAHAEGLRKSGIWPVVAVGYMNYSQPTFLEAVQVCADAGADTIIVVPYFLVPGFFVKKTLPERIVEARLLFSDLRFEVAPALGFDERLADAILQSAADPLGPEEWRGDLASAARGCRAIPECPLYGTSKCPRRGIAA